MLSTTSPHPKGYNGCPECGGSKSFNSPQCLKCAMAERRRTATSAFKICSQCGGDPQPISVYSKNSQRAGGIEGICFDCRKKNRTKYREKNNARAKTYYASTRQAQADRNRTHRLKRFGVSPDWYSETLNSQNGRCAICHALPLPTGKLFPIDHNHACCPDKSVCERCRRGILCARCNWALGVIENKSLLDAALLYLRRFPLIK